VWGGGREPNQKKRDGKPGGRKKGLARAKSRITDFQGPTDADAGGDLNLRGQKEARGGSLGRGEGEWKNQGEMCPWRSAHLKRGRGVTDTNTGR